MQNRLQICYNTFSMTAAGAGMQNQRRAMARRTQDLARVQDAVQLAQQHRTRRAGESLRSAAALAQSLNPYGILARGYAIVTQDGAVRTVDALRPGQNITLHGAGAEADCIVQGVRPQTEQERETP